MPTEQNNRNFESGAQRDASQGKGRYDLIYPGMLRRLALRYEEGAKNYGARDWEQGIPDSSLYDSAQRHLARWMDGDQSEDHLAAVLWNVSALVFNEENISTKETKVRDLQLPWRSKASKRFVKGRIHK